MAPILTASTTLAIVRELATNLDYWILFSLFRTPATLLNYCNLLTTSAALLYHCFLFAASATLAIIRELPMDLQYRIFLTTPATLALDQWGPFYLNRPIRTRATLSNITQSRTVAPVIRQISGISAIITATSEILTLRLFEKRNTI